MDPADGEGAINEDAKALDMFETIRAHGGVRMGLFDHVDEAARCPGSGSDLTTWIGVGPTQVIEL